MLYLEHNSPESGRFELLIWGILRFVATFWAMIELAGTSGGRSQIATLSEADSNATEVRIKTKTAV